jgi:hypothetical protein
LILTAQTPATDQLIDILLRIRVLLLLLVPAVGLFVAVDEVDSYR